MPNKNLLNIFKPGSFTPMGAKEPVVFTADDLQDAARVYDPALHRAPIIIGHQDLKTAPAYGHVAKLTYSADGLEAEPEGMDLQFSELVNRQAFPHISAGWYPKDHPRNPAPGHLYLHEVSFLGAVPPAVRNLRQPRFAFLSDEVGIVRFSSEWDDVANAGLWRKLREWIIEKFGKDEADKVIPSYDVQTLEASAQQELAEAQAEDAACADGDPNPVPSFAGTSPETSTMNPEQESALRAENEQLKAELKAKSNAAMRTEFTQFAESLVAPSQAEKAKLQSKHKQTVIDLLMFACAASASDGTIQFGEGDNQGDPVEKVKAFLSDLPETISFSEDATTGNAAGAGADGKNDEAMAMRARVYRDKVIGSGRMMSFAEAVTAVNNNLDRS